MQPINISSVGLVSERTSRTTDRAVGESTARYEGTVLGCTKCSTNVLIVVLQNRALRQVQASQLTCEWSQLFSEKPFGRHFSFVHDSKYHSDLAFQQISASVKSPAVLFVFDVLISLGNCTLDSHLAVGHSPRRSQFDRDPIRSNLGMCNLPFQSTD